MHMRDKPEDCYGCVCIFYYLPFTFFFLKVKQLVLVCSELIHRLLVLGVIPLLNCLITYLFLIKFLYDFIYFRYRGPGWLNELGSWIT